MLQTISNFTQNITGVSIYDVGKAVFLVILGYFIAKLSSAGFIRAMTKLGSNYQAKLVHRIIFYIVFIIFIIAAMQHLGFKLNVLLGAAGILSVSLGFASQTSASNIISGLFLIGEKPFVVGDTISLDSTSGQVIAIDLLSVKIRTNDNTMVRIPNEVLIKSNVTNLTRFRTRRFDLQLGVSYKENLDKVRKVLFDVVDKNDLCLKDPAPILSVLNFGESAINLQFSVWASKSQFSEMKMGIPEQVKKAFEKNNIEMPFPQLTISMAEKVIPISIEK